jgi:hypothetical protein
MKFTYWGAYCTGKNFLKIQYVCNRKSYLKTGWRNDGTTVWINHPNTPSTSKFTTTYLGWDSVNDRLINFDQESEYRKGSEDPKWWADKVFENVDVFAYTKNFRTLGNGVEESFSGDHYQQPVNAHKFADEIIKYNDSINILFGVNLLTNIPASILEDNVLDLNEIRNIRKFLSSNTPLYDPCLKPLFENRINLYPFKDNIHQCLLDRLLQLHTREQSWFTLETMFSDIKNNSRQIYFYLDNIIKNKRLIEQLLIREGIDYKYFDMDNDSYAETFNLEKEVIRESAYLPYVDNFPHELRDFIDKYISDKNITDLRISGAETDNLLWELPC